MLPPDIAQVFQRPVDAGTVPGIAYGIVIDGALADAGGFGTTDTLETSPPGADTVFRIASMTKSFTAAAILLLRDQGSLRLDQPIGDLVPELADLRGPTDDSPAITVRHLLTMSGGFPTDDPWADRLLPLADPAFTSLLRGGFTFETAPGTTFAYSNLGYAMLGRAIARMYPGCPTTPSSPRDSSRPWAWPRPRSMWTTSPTASRGATSGETGSGSSNRSPPKARSHRWAVSSVPFGTSPRG